MYLILDTNTFIFIFNGYRDTLKHIMEKCHVIASTTEIEKEYRGCARKGGMTQIILLRKLKELQAVGKLEHIGKSKIEGRLKRMRIRRKPEHKRDVKFLLTALALEARYIISTDKHLLDLNPYNNGKTCIKIIRPEEYV